ncbi:MAG: HDOD domain-containing protein [Proteobacteria bacterium]|nr:HDOD domain-containing protein [Pseudomonadota bacterium]MBU1610879.1 HDOD domain-containing protein [Pseudomonadota bacterium]
MRTIRDEFPQALNPTHTIMALPATFSEQDDILPMVTRLREDGFQVAINAALYTLPPNDALSLADMLICDATSSPDHLADLVDLGKKYGLKLIAKKIATQDVFDRMKLLQFDYFHGFFFAQPDISTTKIIPASISAKLRLFEYLQLEEPDFDALSNAIKPDVAITFRLLSFLNSAHFSFSQKVVSVHQAVVLAGWRPICNWLRILLLTDILPNSKSKELAYLSSHRAKFLESVALQAGKTELADALFLTGLFSLLDAILDTPMNTILSHLSLQDEIFLALVDNDGPYAPWLQLAKTIEAGTWDELGELALSLSLPPGSVAEAYRMAFQWADEFFGVVTTT